MRRTLRAVLFPSLGFFLLLGIACTARAQHAKTPYPNMAPVDQYMMERSAEIALARSAGPASIAKDADVLVLGRHGYETAVHGTNGFVCLVERSWTAGQDDPDFWNPKLRGPLCFNAIGARTYLPLTFKRTELVLAGSSQAQMFQAIGAALDKKELPAIEAGSMCFMLSKQGYLGDRAGHWHPHLMFFVPLNDPATWGADVPDSPILASKDVPDRMTVYLIPVAKWSDGTLDDAVAH